MFRSQNKGDDPNELPPPPDPWMVNLYSEVRGVIAKEWEIISKVFANALFVIRQFLERIFNQSVTIIRSLANFVFKCPFRLTSILKGCSKEQSESLP